MRKPSTLKAATLVLTLGLIACGGGRESIRELDDNGERKRPLSYYEATLRPSEFDEEVDVVQTEHAQHHGVNPLEIPTDSVLVEEVVAQGFRIQIFATSSIDEANAARRVAQEKAGYDSVYVVYDPPVYKVRIGDYTERLAANQRLAQIVNQGYPDAWVVADRIYQRRVTRIPRNR